MTFSLGAVLLASAQCLSAVKRRSKTHWQGRGRTGRPVVPGPEGLQGFISPVAACLPDNTPTHTSSDGEQQ